MKKPFVFFLCALMAIICAFTGICAAGATRHVVIARAGRILAESSTAPVATNATQTSATEAANSVKPERKILESAVGETLMLEIGKRLYTDVSSWTSENPKIISVDNGGRADMLAHGSCSVTARFKDNSELIYEITVGKAKKAAAADIFSTAVTANQDVLKKNKKSNKSELYRLYVNCRQNVVTAYTFDDKGKFTVPVRAMLCSTGANDSTIKGEFNTYFKGEWHALYNGVYGQYVTGISGDFLFHSVPYSNYAYNSLEVEEFNKLGTQASMGCVRLAVADAKWIYDNCPVGTYVNIYSSDREEPLGKPQAIKISDFSCGWDPTERAYSSPYRDKRPEIKGAADVTIEKGARFDEKAKVKAFDTCGNDITDRLEVTGRVITDLAGKYKLTYSVTDTLNRTAKKDVWVTVK